MTVLLSAMPTANSTASADEIDVWIGTGSTGIYYLTLDTEKGKLSKPKIAAEVKRPGFLAMHPNGKVLYSTSADQSGSVTAFSTEANDDEALERIKKLVEKMKELRGSMTRKFGPKHQDVVRIDGEIQKAENQMKDRKSESENGTVPGQLKILNTLATGDGGAACIATDKTGRVLFSAQYGGGSTTSYKINEDGTLGERVDVVEHGKGSGVQPKRQAQSHPHWVGTTPDNRFLMVPDLGMDRVVVYAVDIETAKLKQHSKIEVPPGSGPRHMKFHTSGKYAYVLNELTLAISVFEFVAEDAEFKPIQLIETLPEAMKAKEIFNSAAEIRVHPTGKFVYSSNRGHDTISVFSVDPSNGKLTFVEREPIRGSFPRNFNIDPSGKWLIAAGQHSNTLSLFEINQGSGEMTFAGQTQNVPSPICVLFENE
ncbi:MAG: lactonase family protein [Mariniblastus sp.]